MKKKEDNQSNKLKNKNKKLIIILIIVFLIFIVSGFIVGSYLLKGNGKKSNDTNETSNNGETVENEVINNEIWNNNVKELNDLIDKEITDTNNKVICTTEIVTECITEEDKNTKLNTLNNYKEQISNLEENNQEGYDELKSQIDEYLKTDNLVSNNEEKEDNKEQDNKTDNKVSSSSSSSSTGTYNNATLESLINSAPLKPLKTGDAELDKIVENVINKQTNSKMTTYQKVITLYNWVMDKMSYQIAMVDSYEVQELADENEIYYNDAMEIYLALDGFKTYKGSCDNYAAMFMILTRRLGLDSYTINVLNEKGGGHTTVNIKLNGKWYDFDPQGDSNQKKNGKYNYYYLGRNESQMKKVYKQIYRDNGVSRFKKFAKNTNVLSATLTVAGKTYTAKTSWEKLSYQKEYIEVDYKLNEDFIIKFTASENVSYSLDFWEIGGINSIAEFKDSTKSKTINYNKELYYGRQYLHLYLKDKDGRVIYFIIHFNIKERGEKFQVKSSGVDYTYDNYIDCLAQAYNGSGDVKFKATLVETDDPNKSKVKITDSPKGYEFRITNINSKLYTYKIKVTATDAKGNVAVTEFVTHKKS